MFLTTHIDLGNIKVGSKHTLYFPYENISRIISLASPCDCASIGDEQTKQRIVINYTTKEVPIHLQNLGYTKYSIRKEITVTHSSPDNLSEVITKLIFTGEVHQ